MNVLAILETMWDWRGMTSGAGYARTAPTHFRINPSNHSGRRLYKLCGADANLLVTNACKELVSRASEHGTPDPVWLADNIKRLDESRAINVLLVCGKVAQATFDKCAYRPRTARVLKIPHPAARQGWTMESIVRVSAEIRSAQ